MVDQIVELHKEVQKHLEMTDQNCKERTYKKRQKKIFNVGNLVVLHLQKTLLPSGSYYKPSNKKLWPFFYKKKKSQKLETRLKKWPPIQKNNN